MPAPILAALAAGTAIYQGIKSAQQAKEAEELKKRDTTPLAFKEALDLARQGATSTLPGTGTALNRIEAGTNDTLAAATRAGTSATSVMGLLQQSDSNRLNALAALDTRGDIYHQQKNHELTGFLDKEAKYQDRDTQEFDRNKAALTEASQRNLYGAIDKGSQVAAYFLNKAKNKDSDTDDSDFQLESPSKPKKRVGYYNSNGIFDPTGNSLS